ncbi:hypothetical protein [Terrihabitans rhizophilus]|uniref:Tail fiber protein n=1 Tax=Terrihabitans rhizophilus TaxID=3092662 RepID=A0ABU4RQ50_9HYPH|nr:hypothetical protein [Terrihabitans sp. PJ23]MDX6806308.1 hypothetical protein [Terrihabitans sp. PJ23]
MSLTAPSPDNDYLIPLGQSATREFFQGFFTSVGQRLRSLEMTEADYQSAIDLITSQALAIVSANITEVVDVQRQTLIEIQEAADQIIAAYEDIATGVLPAASSTLAPVAGLTATNVQAAVEQLVAASNALGEDIAGFDDDLASINQAISTQAGLLGSKQQASGILTGIAGAGGYAANRGIFSTSGTAFGTYALTVYGRTLAGLADAAALLAQVVGAGAATLTGLGQVITGGFRTTGKDIGALTGTLAFDPGLGNLKYGRRTSFAFTIAPLTEDGFVELFFWTDGTGGTVTIAAGFQNSADYGDTIATDGSYHVQLRRAGGAGFNTCNIRRL